MAVFEFTVKDGFDNARLTGHADVLPAGDIDLYLQKLEGDTWSGDLAEGTSADLTQENLSYVAPTQGQYRIRIHNWAGGPTRVEMTVTFYNASDEPGVAQGGDQPAGWMARLL